MRTPLVATLLLLAVPVTAQIPPQNDQNVVLARRLLQVMHADTAFVLGIDQAMAVQRRSQSGVSKIFFDSLVARVRRRVPEMLDSLAPIYAASLTTADLKDLVRFYESPLGQRFAAAQTAFSSRAEQVGQRWGARMALEVMKDLVDQGIMPTDSLR